MQPLVLGRSDIEQLFTLEEYMRAVEGAFAAYAEGRSLKPALLHVDGVGGEFHVKAGGLEVEGKTYFGLKANGGFFGNAEQGKPAIQGMIYLADGSNGTPLAILDSIHITVMRTGAATAVAAWHLARRESTSVTICGTGRQGRIQLAALAHVFQGGLEKAYVWDRSVERAEAFAREMTEVLGFCVGAVRRAADGTRKSDIVVTATPSHEAFIGVEDVREGTFVAAVGADSPEKQEIDARVLATGTVVTDVTAQCARVGELHHAIAAGLMREEDVWAELGEVIVGRKVGRRSRDEIIVYDATGTALQDTACAAAIYLKAVKQGRGKRVSLA